MLCVPDKTTSYPSLFTSCDLPTVFGNIFPITWIYYSTLGWDCIFNDAILWHSVGFWWPNLICNETDLLLIFGGNILVSKRQWLASLWKRVPNYYTWVIGLHVLKLQSAIACDVTAVPGVGLLDNTSSMLQNWIVSKARLWICQLEANNRKCLKFSPSLNYSVL